LDCSIKLAGSSTATGLALLKELVLELVFVSNRQQGSACATYYHPVAID
jgi:hypothetical protein